MLDQVLDHTHPRARPLPESPQAAAGSRFPLLPIASIRRDPALQLRADGLDPVFVARYSELYLEGEELEAVVAFEDPAGVRWLADGFHRLAAAEVAGRTEHAVDLRRGTRLDALRFAAQANQRHGKPWSKADQANAARRLLSDPEASAGMSQRDVAKLCGLSHTRVNQIAAELRTMEQARVESVSTQPRAHREKVLRLVLERYRAENHLEIALGLKVLRGLAALAEGEALDLDVWERALDMTAAEEQARRDALRARLEAAKARGDVLSIPGAGIQRARPEMAVTTRLRHLTDLEAQLASLEAQAAIWAEAGARRATEAATTPATSAEPPVDELAELRAQAEAACRDVQAGGAVGLYWRGAPRTWTEIGELLPQADQAALEEVLATCATVVRLRQGLAKPEQAEAEAGEDLDDEASDQAEDEAGEDLEDEESDQAEDEAGEDLEDEESDQAEGEAGEGADMEPEQATPPATVASSGPRQQVMFTGRGPHTLNLNAPEGDIRAALESVQARCKVGLADAADIARRVRAALDEAETVAAVLGRKLEDLAPLGVWTPDAIGGDVTIALVHRTCIEVKRGYPFSALYGPRFALELTLRESKVTLRPKEQ